MKTNLTPGQHAAAVHKARFRSSVAAAKRAEAEALETFDSLLDDVRTANAAHNKMLKLVELHYVKVRDLGNLMTICSILQETAELYGVGTEAKGGYWVPCWFFLALLPAAKRGDRDKAEEQAYRVVFDDRYQKAMETKYAMTRRLDVDNETTGLWL